jgi:parallel beta-helix repeat protein
MIVSFTMLSFGATYYISNLGNDLNSGLSISLPWKTLGKVNASTFAPGDQILFNRGDTFYGSLTIGQSGTSSSRIVYGAYGTGANPIITGLTAVTSWTNLGSNIWESTNTVSSLSTLNMVVINGVNTGMGRTPNTGYYYYQSHSGSTSITSNNLNGTPNWTGAELAFNNSDWSVKRRPITFQSGGTLNFAIDPNDTYIQKDGQKFIIQNDSRTLDIQNEWYFNPTTKKLKVYSTSQPANVQVSTIETLLTNASKNYITLDGISFIGSNGDNIVFSSASYFTIQNCTINYSGLDGIYSSWSNGSNLIVENCTIDNSNNNGIGTTPYLINCTIRSNTVTNSGIIFGANAILPDSRNGGIICHAIAATGEGSLFEYNTIDNCGYVGIRFYGANTIVQKNVINNFCMVNTDGGGIYSWNGTNTILSGTKVLYNIITSTKAQTTYSETHLIAGVYLDDYSNGIEVVDNTIIGSPMGVFLHEAYNVIVQRNTMFNNDVGLRCFGVTSPFYMKNITVQDNIVVAKASGQLAIHFDPLELIKPTFKSSNNCYARPINDTKTIGGYIRTPSFSSISNTVSEWQTYSGQDANSTKSPQAITTESDMRCEYNDTNTPKTINLSQPMMDMRGVKYTGTITLQPYKSLVLIKDVTSASVPGAPTSVSATAGNASASITFVAPASNGGSAITGYTVTSSPAGGVDASSGSTSLTRTITGLTNGTAYTFTVKAVNSVGTSIASAPSNSVTPQASSMATTFTFTGPSSGNINSPANFTVTPNNPFTGSITITPSGTASAGLSAKVLTFSNSSVAQTFTITPTVAGSITLNATNSSNLSNPASLTYTVNAVVPDAPASVITQKYSIYSFEESSGTKVIDSMSSYDGDIINTTSRVIGISGNALSTTGNGYVNLGQVYGDVQDGLTLSAWVKPTPSGSYEGVIMHGGPNTDTFALYLNYTSGTIAFKTEGTAVGKWTEIANSTIWDGSWHLLSATYNGSQKIIYLDAVPIITVSATGMIESGAGYNLLIGAGRDEIPVPSTYQYQGIIDEVRIYNYALNSTQISSLFTTANTPTANTFTFTGPSSGNVNSTSANFTVTPNNLFTGTITITPSGSGSVGLSAKVLTFSNSSVAQTFTITPVVAGSITLSATNNSTLNNPASLIYTSQAVVPDAPTSVFASAGNASASISFVAPANNGGSAITGYTVTSVPAGGIDADAGSTSFTHSISGLTNGIAYTFTVKATNSIGTSVPSLASNSVSPFVENVVIKQGDITPLHFITVWQGLNGLNHMNINVVSALLEDLSLSADDEIAVFSGSACVGAAKLTKSIVPDDNTTYLTILASQDDGSNNGFINNDSILIKIWDNKTQTELQVNEAVYRSDILTWKTDGKYSPGSTAVVEIAAYKVYTQSIELLKGYNMISTNVSAQNPDVSAVTKPLLDQGNLIKMQDETGNSFENWGDFGGWINKLGSLEKTEGYKIQVANNCTLQVTGRRIAMPLDINLKAGWNIISFPRTDFVDAMGVVQTLIDQNKLVKVQDETGNSIENWGIYGGWKNSIGNFLPGKAYKVKMAVDAVLTFQESYTKSAVVLSKSEETEYFNSSVEGNGTDHMNINITGLKSIGIALGDEFAAFDGEVCVGTTKITEANLLTGSACLVTSFSTDDQNSNGFKVGNPIQISVWSKLSGNESKVITEVINGQMRYEKNASVLVQMKSLTIATIATNLNDVVKIDVFPNPCQDKVTVRFSELPEENSRIEISDISGRKIISRIISGTSEEFNLDHLTPGLYIVKSILGKSEFVHKLIVNK